MPRHDRRQKNHPAVLAGAPKSTWMVQKPNTSLTPKNENTDSMDKLAMSMSNSSILSDSNSSESTGEEVVDPAAQILEASTPPPTPAPRVKRKGAAPPLPMEIVLMIFENIPKRRQETFAAAVRVCRMWYYAGIGFLYRHPQITGKNYHYFLSTLCPSERNEREARTTSSASSSHLGALVRTLNLSYIVHEARPSQNAKLLHRCQANLLSFTAPQASFSTNCIVALKNCRKLHHLDLSLVSQSIKLDELLVHISQLPSLQELLLPRAYINYAPYGRLHDGTAIKPPDPDCLALGIEPPPIHPSPWPPQLTSIALSGSSITHLLTYPSSSALKLPPTISTLYISHCPFTPSAALLSLPTLTSPLLTSLSINFPMPCLSYNALDSILLLCPHLRYLLVAVDYITAHLFDEVNSPAGHPLRQLDLESSGHLGVDMKVAPNDLFIAVAEERLSGLRRVRVSERLGWMGGGRRRRQDTVDLGEMLEAVGRESGEREACGVWEFGGAGGVVGMGGGEGSWMCT